ncbi:MAG: flagellar biosynthetic protein FliR [Rhodothalassiaceae bacterium]
MIESFLGQEVFAFLILFLRVAALFALAPAIGERSIPIPARLVAALSIALVMLPVMADRVPAMPQSMLGLAGLIVGEITIGILLAVVGQLIQAALHTAGTIVGFTVGLAFAQQFDPFQGTQSAITSSFFTIMGVALIFITDLHLVMLEALFDSYLLFPAGDPLPVGDMTQIVVETVGAGFSLGLRLASPFIVFGLVFYAGLGVTARLIPTLQVFFVALPVNIFAGFLILLIALPGIMMAFLTAFEDSFARFIR